MKINFLCLLRTFYIVSFVNFVQPGKLISVCTWQGKKNETVWLGWMDGWNVAVNKCTFYGNIMQNHEAYSSTTIKACIIFRQINILR